MTEPKTLRPALGVEWLAQVIRTEDPKHDLGAAALAERIIAAARAEGLDGLAKYGQHLDDCNVYGQHFFVSGTYPCDCGLDAALAAYREADR
jgi:hypothetical protein